MENFILVVHVVLALGIIGLIMLQQGKGAEMGASFGSGSSQTVFGAAGSGNFFSRLTGILTAIFFVTSVTLGIVAKKSSEIDENFIPAQSAAEAVMGDLEAASPAVDESPSASDVSAALEQAEPVEALKTEVESVKDDAQKTLNNTVKALESETQTQ